MRMTLATGRRLVVAVAVAVLAGVTGAAPAPAQELLISAAVSMRDAVTELGSTFATRRPGVTVRYNFGASGELQKQIEAGAPVDLFISAGQRQMDELERRGLIVPATRRLFARNVLVAIRPADAPYDLARPADLLDPRVGKIVIGNPRTVPVGQYTEDSLRTLGLWERLQAKLVLAENVRQALDYVARGEVDAGFVYATDVAVRRERVREAFRPGEDTYRPVTYPAAVVKDSRQAALGLAFVELLMGAEGQAVLRRFGFQPPPGAR
jgi:molybdate transport system substrate-binding protein